jgi:hypothetical protein
MKYSLQPQTHGGGLGTKNFINIVCYPNILRLHDTAFFAHEFANICINENIASATGKTAFAFYIPINIIHIPSPLQF